MIEQVQKQPDVPVEQQEAEVIKNEALEAI